MNKLYIEAGEHRQLKTATQKLPPRCEIGVTFNSIECNLVFGSSHHITFFTRPLRIAFRRFNLTKTKWQQ